MGSASGESFRELPVIRPSAAAGSRRGAGRFRPFVLLGVHAVIALHVGHWLATRRTLSPVEPSEAMATLELGLVNAGAIFFVLAILSTVIFGRFFCGWGCHVVALQDLSGAILRRLGIRPVAVRSRALALAPFVVAAYMFAWPTFAREVLGRGPPLPALQMHLVTEDFWRTFPGPVFAVLTLATCGFLAVLLLGSKGFCTNGCPYGAFFLAADRLAPMRIVAEGCQRSGHCTPACTSNVLVHAEVRDHAMVVDPACMKCMDCVAACPNDALKVGWAKPSLLVGRAAARGLKSGRLPWGEEIAAGAVGLGATLALRGLYDGPPLLMAVALGVMTAFVALQSWRLLRGQGARIASLSIRPGARTLGRLAFLAASIAWLAFVSHSGFVQWHRWRGRVELARTEVARADLFRGDLARMSLSPAHHAAHRSAEAHFRLASRWGLVPVPEVELGLAWCALLRDDFKTAEALTRAVLARDPSDPARHDNLVEIHAMRGDPEEVARALRAKREQAGPKAEDSFLLGQALMAVGAAREAADAFEESARLAPDNAASRFNLGALLTRLGRPAEAVRWLGEAEGMAPGDPDVLGELGLALLGVGDPDGAAAAAARVTPGRTAAPLEELRARLAQDPVTAAPQPEPR